MTSTQICWTLPVSFTSDARRGENGQINQSNSNTGRPRSFPSFACSGGQSLYITLAYTCLFPHSSSEHTHSVLRKYCLVTGWSQRVSVYKHCVTSRGFNSGRILHSKVRRTADGRKHSIEQCADGWSRSVCSSATLKHTVSSSLHCMYMYGKSYCLQVHTYPDRITASPCHLLFRTGKCHSFCFGLYSPETQEK